MKKWKQSKVCVEVFFNKEQKSVSGSFDRVSIRVSVSVKINDPY